MQKILLLEDDLNLNRGIALLLSREGYDVRQVYTIKIVSKESILEHVWDIDGQFVDDNTVTVNISRLKNKLGTEEIANVRGLGYIWTGKVNKN